MITIDISKMAGQIESIIGNIGDNLEEVLEKSALEIARKMTKNGKGNAQKRIYDIPIPTSASGRPLWVRTGNYKRSINTTIDRERLKYVLKLKSQLVYSASLEWGNSRGHRARYILTDAVERNIQEYKRVVIKNLNSMR